jgi:microcompartment protein CcmK/EutM
MLLADVVGHVVATAKHASFEGFKMMLVRPVTLDGRPCAAEMMAIDAVGAGAGERVLVVVEGRSATDAVGRKLAPVDAAIVGIVDRIDLFPPA